MNPIASLISPAAIKRRRHPALACLGAGTLALCSSLGLSSCDTATGQGAGIGAASGAIIGGLTGSTRNAAFGAAAGAGAGALIGSIVDRDREPEMYVRRRDYPVGTRSGRRDTTISPYAPYHEIDTRGAYPGDLVRDPSCGRIFVKP